jgi:hypothetical protein
MKSYRWSSLRIKMTLRGFVPERLAGNVVAGVVVGSKGRTATVLPTAFRKSRREDFDRECPI